MPILFFIASIDVYFMLHSSFNISSEFYIYFSTDFVFSFAANFYLCEYIFFSVPWLNLSSGETENVAEHCMAKIYVFCALFGGRTHVQRIKNSQFREKRRKKNIVNFENERRKCSISTRGNDAM